MHVKVVEFLKNDSVTADFGEYFDKEYSAKTRSWAYCYRLHAGLNTYMHLERMHGIIKHIYLKGKKVKRLDIAIHALMRFLRDKIVGQLISFHKKKLTRKISEIRKRHKSSLELNVNEVIQVDDAKWKVLSSDMTEFYEVTKVVTNCECDLRCVECNICVHGFFCTCPDSSIKSNMCKHIHLVQRNSMQQSATFASTEPPSKRRKIEHQRFYSTKKQKRQTSSSIVVPTAEEKQKIALGFIINH